MYPKKTLAAPLEKGYIIHICRDPFAKETFFKDYLKWFTMGQSSPYKFEILLGNTNTLAEIRISELHFFHFYTTWKYAKSIQKWYILLLLLRKAFSLPDFKFFSSQASFMKLGLH